MPTAKYPSWGLLDSRPRSANSFLALRGQPLPPNQQWLPYGNGRSYGDSCHLDTGCLVHTRPCNALIAFDSHTGIIDCEPGLLLGEILQRVIAEGWFLAVTPGTQFVTVGGAIANDVHGKNHHASGSFGNYVLDFVLQRSDGSEYHCSRNQNRELFAATIGGMGLTGIISRARLQLKRVPAADILQTAVRFTRLEQFFEQVADMDANHEYSVAWIDQLARGYQFGRGILMGGNHASSGEPGERRRKNWLGVPVRPPFSLLNRPTLKIFNALYLRKEPAGRSQRVVHWPGYFYPLDTVHHWNRLYGPRGLYQHQSVYPAENALQTTRELLQCSQDFGHASFLTVLKRFGPHTSPGLLSFPTEGFTLTLDFAAQGQRSLELLRRLDEIVIAAGGRINPYKDARMGADIFAASFPHWRELEALRDPVILSDFWKRTAMQLN